MQINVIKVMEITLTTEQNVSHFKLFEEKKLFLDSTQRIFYYKNHRIRSV